MTDSKRNAAKILGSFDWLAEGSPAVIDATGAEVCTQTAILVTRKNGIFIQAGMGPNEIVVPISTICAREITVLGSFRYNEGCYEQAIDLVTAGHVDLKALVSHTFAFEDALKAFDTTAAAAENTIKVVIRGQE